jgi:GNAT superfamily N-acetyltransferase
MNSQDKINQIKIIRDNSRNQDFSSLVKLLDKDLLNRYGEQQSFFNQFNKVDKINNIVVAYVNDIPVGCGAIKKYNDDCIEMKRMFVKDEYRGKGIAKKILTELETWASELNFRLCILETGKSQPEAIYLYQKVGYTITANYGQYIGVENSVCMNKALS